MPRHSRKRRKKARSSAKHAKHGGPKDGVEAEEFAPRYKHEPLSDDERFFRVLELLPGKEGETIHCRLRTYSIDFPPTYEAISYVWGPPEERKDILCHRKHLRVPRTLCDVLDQLRNERESRILWADSICIDQESHVERGHQVQLMRAIYSQAKNVIACLVHDGGFDAQAVFGSVGLLDETMITGGKEAFDQLVKQTPDVVWDGLRSLLNNDWFYRVWTLQEIGLASNATLVHGKNSMPWERLDRLSTYLGPSSLPLRAIFFSPVAIRRSFKEDSTDLRAILYGVLTYKCSDPRDRIYGVLGHASFDRLRHETTGEPLMKADYSLSAADVFFKFAKALLRLRYPLDILSFVFHDDTAINDPNTISWVPQLPPPPRAILFTTPHKAVGLARKYIDMPRNALFVLEDKRLRVEGVCVDSITWVSERLKRNQPDFRKVKGIWTKIREMSREGDAAIHDVVRRCFDTLYSGCDENWYRFLSTKETFEDFLEDWVALLHLSDAELERSINSIDIEKNSDTTWRAFIRAQFVERFLFISRKGFFGLGPTVSRPGDKICVLFGAEVPFILRPTAESGEYRLCGECYFQEWMYGKAVDMLGQDEGETFVLV